MDIKDLEKILEDLNKDQKQTNNTLNHVATQLSTFIEVAEERFVHKDPYTEDKAKLSDRLTKLESTKAMLTKFGVPSGGLVGAGSIFYLIYMILTGEQPPK